MAKIENPMAFPTHDANPGTDPRFQVLTGGMTLRDYFAGQAISSVVLLAIEAAKQGNQSSPVTERELSAACYSFADAMVAAGAADGDA